MYRVNEAFLSIQGEGHWAGRPAVFVRFSSCNLWSGVESDRATAICTFCDTNFVDGHTMTAAAIYGEACNLWTGDDDGQPMVVFTGGEPMLQLDAHLVTMFRSEGWYTAIETNGTKPIPFWIDWVCVSPKTPTIKADCEELKLVYPQQRITPDMFTGVDAEHYWLSPMDGPNLTANTAAAYRYCLEHPQWRLNTQLHKTIGVR